MARDEESDFSTDGEADYDDDYEEDLDYEEDFDYDEEPAEPAPASGPQLWAQSAMQRIRGTSGKSGAPLSEKEAKRAIYMVNERERLLSFASAVVAMGFGVAIYVSETSNKHFRLAKSQLTPQTMLLIGLAAGVLLIIATLIGRRALIGFMVFFAGAAFSTNSFILALPFWALAFYLLYRSSRIQRQRTQELRAERAARPRTANTRGSSGRASSSGRA
ncbi:MAG TPA: hypothetical protein VHY77_07995, partial [Acidimicrobiales bacterium]|nr:hypothetical protein [Acidimicrobiales bacterium]